MSKPGDDELPCNDNVSGFPSMRFETSGECARPLVGKPYGAFPIVGTSGLLSIDLGLRGAVAALSTLFLVASLGMAFADDLTTSGDAKSLGFSAARLARIAPWYQARFDSFSPSDGLVPGAVVAIAKGGKLAYLQAIGFQDRAKTIPMKTNSIFWIASMSKPVTSVAAMILVDDGKLDLDAPVARYLPEIGDMRVASETTDPATGETDYGLDPPKRPMTVRDLLRHTSGLIYPEMDFAYPERGLADAAAEFGIRCDPYALQLDGRDRVPARHDAGGFRFRSGALAARPSARRGP